MLKDPLVFVDIETTGMSVTRDRIIEIAIIRVEENRVVKEFSTTLNPGMYIPPSIFSITGINPELLVDSPTFREVGDEIKTLLDGAIFVAHNVRFDYGFIKQEFKRLGISFTARQLCTVKLSKLLYPEQRSHNLDSVIARHNFVCEERHRAYGDANVLWQFYSHVIANYSPELLGDIFKKLLKRPSVPINVSEKKLYNLPETSGVYIFYGNENIPLYIGKSINIRERVLSHFSGDYLASSEMKIAQQVKDIETIETPGELSALFLESSLIKKMQPLYNRKLRLKRKLTVARKTVNDNYNTIHLEQVDGIQSNEINEICGIFSSPSSAKQTIRELAKEKSLCPRLCGLESGKGPCFSSHLGWCKGACQEKEHFLHYNLRFDEAFFEYRIARWPYQGAIAIRETDSQLYIIVDNWCVLGSVATEDGFENESIMPITDFDVDNYKILKSFLRNTAKNIEIKPIVLPQLATM